MTYYPTLPRLAVVLSLSVSPDEARPLLAAACEAARTSTPDIEAWAGSARTFAAPDADNMFAGRPIGAKVDAVIEVTGTPGGGPEQLLEAARRIGETLSGFAIADESDVVLGTAYCAKSGKSRAALVMTFSRDRRTDEKTFLHWWQLHHSRFNLHSPTGHPASRGFVSYQLLSRDDALSQAAATASGFRSGYDMYESIFVDDPVRYIADVVASGHGTAALHDEEGFLSHEWRIGTPEQARQARENGRDLMRIAMLEVVA